MGPRPRKLPVRRHREPVGPWGHYVDDVRIRKALSYRRMYDSVNQVAHDEGERGVEYGRHSVRNWIGGVVPHADTLRWIAKAWKEPIEEVSAAAEAHIGWRYEQRLRSAVPQAPPPPPEPRVVGAPALSIIAPSEQPADHPVDGSEQAVPLPITTGDSSCASLTDNPDEVVRRHFLQQLFVAIIGGGAMSSVAPGLVWAGGPRASVRIDIDQLIAECTASIQAGWRLMHGRDIVVVPSVLTTWLPALDALIAQPSPRRARLAALAAEGYILGGLVTVLQGQYDRSEWFCCQAVEYARAADDPNLIVAALKHLATKYLDARYPLLTLSTYQRALPLLDRASPLLRSRIHLGLALAHAQCGNHTGAERYLDSAHEMFPERPADDPAFRYADCRRSSLGHYGGLIQLVSHRPRHASDAFAAALSERTEVDIPERTVLELVNCQAEAACVDGDVELACVHLETAVHGARWLRSAKRLRDSLSIYEVIRSRWPTEPHVRRIRELFPADQPRTGARLDEE